MTYPRSLLALGALAMAPPSLAQHCHLEAFRPGDSDLGDWFGRSIAISGDTAVIGASGQDNGLVQNTGGFYVYEKSPNGWAEASYHTTGSLNFSAHFGWQVAIDGSTIVAGLAGPTSENAERLYVFEEVGGVWTETTVLRPAVPTEGSFGMSFAIDGDVIVVGAPYDDDFGSQTGTAIVFERHPIAGWREVAELLPSDAQGTKRIGWSVAVDGDVIAVGAPWDDDQGISSGSVTLWRRTPTGWVEEQQVRPPIGGFLGEFGLDVTLEGSTLVVGAAHDDTPGPCGGSVCDYGAAYVFEDSGGQWQHEQKLQLPDAQIDDFFGARVQLAGDRLAVRAGEFWSAGPRVAVHLYERTNGLFLHSDTLRAPDQAIDDSFGFGLALEGDDLLLGAPRVDLDEIQTGRVHTYELGLPPIVTTYCLCASSGPCGNHDPSAGCTNATGGGALLTACGDPSVSGDWFSITVEGIEPGRKGALFMGGATNAIPFSQGNLCVAPGATGFFRYPIQAANAQGVFTREAGIAAYTQATFPAAGHLTPSSTWYFQVWYRDPGGPCPSGGPNLSNAIAATFTP